jgi:hypothetical protein
MTNNYPKAGDKLTKEQVVYIINKKAGEYSENPSSNYKQLTDIFEACFGYVMDIRLTYNNKENVFQVWEDQNYN